MKAVKGQFTVEITDVYGNTEPWTVCSVNSVQARYDAEQAFCDTYHEPKSSIFYTGRAVPRKCEECGILLTENDDQDDLCQGCFDEWAVDQQNAPFARQDVDDYDDWANRYGFAYN